MTSPTATSATAATPPLPSISPTQAVAGPHVRGRRRRRGAKAAAEERGLPGAQAQHRQARAKKRLADKVSTTVSQRGLKVRLVTDDLLFASGSATIESQALGTLAEIGGMIADEHDAPRAGRGSHRRPPHRQLAVPVQLAAVGRPRRRRRPAPHRRRRRRRPADAGRLRRGAPVAPNTTTPGRPQQPARRDHPHPAARDCRHQSSGGD